MALRWIACLAALAGAQEPPANPPAPEGRFVDAGDGTVTDSYRRLQWTKTDSGREMSWEEALAWCRDLRRGGHADWRLPTHYELWTKLYMGLQPGGKWAPERRVAPFEWTGDFYWSATDGDAGHGYPGMNVVGFQKGLSGTDRRDKPRSVRACRTPPPPKGPRFQDNRDGTVTDLHEGLTWAVADSAVPMTIKEAEGWCRRLERGGRKGWRVPTAEELHDQLYVGLEADRPGLGLDRRVEPFEWSGEAYWSGSILISSGEGGHGRDVVRFLDGSRGWVSTHNVRLVRACRDGP